ncbi:hypothetical protein IF188_08710 [Microbacterium sp. NEAU-LLC]|uniref:Uncharacterized protein n=1 Tax=Microbacterium helvum TaxID=2773713 RepID=A0ABR8NRV3_9MICO|nr:hypothetical protein [Microbacterium helvum]MBD3941771.1 hypothetical protein [Microbacterium helvum]
MDTNLYTAQLTASQRAATLARENRIVVAQRDRSDRAPVASHRGFSLIALARAVGRRGTPSGSRAATVASSH